MGYKYAEIAFTDAVKSLQQQSGSRDMYARLEESGDRDFTIGEAEAAFIAARDSLYMATVSETGWPYVQHRGGQPGFIRVLDERTIGFADFVGNRQYISTGNLATNDRVSLILVDYPNRARMKLMGHVKVIPTTDEATMKHLADPRNTGRIERGFSIEIEALDWNCPQHITPRFTVEETDGIAKTLAERVATLEAEIKRLKQS